MPPGRFKPHPRDGASLLSRLTFWHLYPLLIAGVKRPLEKSDLSSCQEDHSSEKLCARLKRNWEKEVDVATSKGRRASYFRAIFQTFGRSYFLYNISTLVAECIFRITGPVFLGYLIRYFNDTSLYPSYTGALLAAGIIISNVTATILHHPALYGTRCVGMKARIASCSLIYQKALRLSTNALGQTTVGQAVNLLSNDVNRFDNSFIFTHYLIIGPLQAAISTCILWQELGPSCLAGISLVILYVPMQSFMGKVFSRLRLKTAILTEERVRHMNEMVNAIRAIKMYAWEKPFYLIIKKARKLEINVIMKSNYFRAINLALFFTSSKIIVFLSLLVFVVTGNVLSAEKVFVTSSIINNIRMNMTLFFPYAVSMGSEMLISCQRIQKFLEMEERDVGARILSWLPLPPNSKGYQDHRLSGLPLPPNPKGYQDYRLSGLPLPPNPKICYLKGQGISARWNPCSSEDTLANVSFEVKPGEIMAVVGPVGSGKSSLLHAILRELPLKRGSLDVKGKISYSSQEAWLFSGSVRDNILFGQPYNDKRYKEVIRVCCLQRDMELFSQGDATPVGEKGATLSGGQKARINLARAVYFDADIYLLDDPLSAVDSHVGKALFEQCISGFLRKKVVVLVTHQMQFIRKTSQILILRNGHVQAQEPYSEVKTMDFDFAEILSETEEEQRRTLHGSSPNLKDDLEFDNSNRLDWSIRENALNSVHQDETNAEDEVQEYVNENEAKLAGKVNSEVYFKYFTFGGGPLFLLVLLLTSISAQVLFTGSDYWLSQWTNNEQLHGALSFRISNSTVLSNSFSFCNSSLNFKFCYFSFTDEDRTLYVYIYAIMTILLLMMVLIRTVLFFRMCMTSSRHLHNRMFAAIVEAPLQFFEKHSIGQILNRFTKDTGQVDDLLPLTLYDFLEIFLHFVGIIAIILYLNIWLAIPLAILGVLLVLLRWVYVSSARDIKRLEGITRSPVFTHMSSTFQGLATIRAFEAQEAMTSKFDSYQDLHTSTWHLFICTSRLFAVFLDFLSSAFIAAVTINFMLSDAPLGGDVGLGISMAMMLFGMLQWGVRQSAEVESHMTSVERILEYCGLESEVSKEANLVPKEPGWPSKGMILFQNVYLYYNQDDSPVLKDLNFSINSGEKIGIVGRTGAGKSSLLTCLFRLSPPDGIIYIDGLRTDILSLEDLRSSLSIIPQDPTLFTGSVRYNLDPFSVYSDEQIWRALEEVQLKEAVGQMSGQLNAPLTEGGSNLSVGQRQLVCLARAILKDNKILVMDEATANVDPETDFWIQKTIREKFKKCTVLTIAHRLHTIVDSDKVMVLDAGKLKEFDAPYTLLKNEESIFTDLVNKTGRATSQQLLRLAKEAFFSKLGCHEPNEIFTQAPEYQSKQVAQEEPAADSHGNEIIDNADEKQFVDDDLEKQKPNFQCLEKERLGFRAKQCVNDSKKRSTDGFEKQSMDNLEKQLIGYLEKQPNDDREKQPTDDLEAQPIDDNCKAQLTENGCERQAADHTESKTMNKEDENQTKENNCTNQTMAYHDHSGNGPLVHNLSNTEHTDEEYECTKL